MTPYLRIKISKHKIVTDNKRSLYTTSVLITSNQDFEVRYLNLYEYVTNKNVNQLNYCVS